MNLSIQYQFHVAEMWKPNCEKLSSHFLNTRNSTSNVEHTLPVVSGFRDLWYKNDRISVKISIHSRNSSLCCKW